MNPKLTPQTNPHFLEQCLYYATSKCKITRQNQTTLLISSIANTVLFELYERVSTGSSLVLNMKRPHVFVISFN